MKNKAVLVAVEGATDAAAAANNGLSVSMAGASTVAQGFAARIKVLGAQLLAFVKTPAGAIITLVATVGAAAYAIVKHAEQVRESIREASEQSIENINNLKEEMSSIENVVEKATDSFATLSRGVDLLNGKNISLSDDEYKEFLDISNQLANAFPTLTRVYDENGNAIVNLGTDAASVKSTLDDLLQTQRELNNFRISQELPNIYKEAKISSEEYGKQIDELKAKYDSIQESFNNIDLAKQIENTGAIELSGDNWETLYNQLQVFRDILNEIGVDYQENTWQQGDKSFASIFLTDLSDENIAHVKEELAARTDEIARIYDGEIKDLGQQISSIENEQEALWSTWESNIMSAIVDRAEYKNLSDSLKSTVQRVISGIDWNSLDISEGAEALQYAIEHGLDLVAENPKIANAFNVNDLFTQGKISYADYKVRMDEMLAYFEQALSEEDFSRLQSSLENKLADLTEEAIFLGNNSYGMSRIESFIQEYGVNTISELQALIYELQVANGDIMSAFVNYLKNNATAISDERASEIGSDLNQYLTTLDALKTAQEELSSTGVLTAETSAALTGTFGDLSNILIMTSKGWELNTDAIEAYKNGEDDIIQSDLRSYMEELQDQYASNQEELNSLNSQIEYAKQIDSEYVDELENKKLALESTQSSLQSQISILQNYQAELYNAKSSYHDFIESFNEAKPGDEYDTVVSKLEDIKELAENSEWGDSSIREFVDLFSDEDLSSAPIERIMALYDEAMKKANRYFTESSQGSVNFIEKLKELGYAAEDAQGYLTFDVGNINEVASQFGMDVDAILISFENLQRYGYEINLGDYVSQITDINTLTDAIARLRQEREQLVNSPSYNQADLNAIDEMIAKYQEQINAITKVQEQITKLNSMSVSDAGYGDLSAEIDAALANLGMTKEQVMNIHINADTTSLENGISETTAAEKTTSVGMDPNSPLEGDIRRAVSKPVYVSPMISSSSLDSLYNKVASKFAKPVTISVNYRTIGETPRFPYLGTGASWRGTAAFSMGSFTAGYNGRALVGELGPELRVRNGIATIIGANGAEYTDVRKDDIIFNHKQTEQLQKYGHINSRGKAFAEGSVHAFAGGTGGINNVTGGGPAGLLTSMKKSASEAAKETEKAAKKSEKAADNAAKSAQKAAEKVQETKEATEDIYDYFERMVSVLEQSVSYIDDALENINGAIGRNFLIDKQIAYTNKAIEGYTQAIQMYSAEAEAALAKLPVDIQQKIVDGQVEIARYMSEGDETVTSLIDDYVEWDDKVRDCEQSIEQQTTSLREMGKLKFDNIIDDYEQITTTYENANDLLEKQIGLIEEAGGLVGEDLYASQRTNYERMIEVLEAERKAAVEAITVGLNDGTIKQGDEHWMEMMETINGIDGALIDAKTSVEELNNAIVQSRWDVFDLAREQIENINSDLNGMIDLFSDATDIQVSDAHGTWTNEALAQLGLLAQQYELNKAQAQEYSDAQDSLDRMYEDGVYSTTEYLEKLAELKQEQWNSIDAYRAAEDAIMSLNETRVQEECDAIQEEIDAFKELTDAQIEALNATEELHDYQMSIAEKTKSVADIEKQLAAMQNDTTAATVARRKQLEEELEEAKKDLRETERDHSVQEQEDALNKQYEEYEKTRLEDIENLKATLNDRESIIYQSFEQVKNNANLVGDQIASVANQHGINISSAITNAWDEGANALSYYGDYLHSQSDAFMIELDGVQDSVYELKDQADQASLSLGYMFNVNASNLIANINAAKDAVKDLQTAADSMVPDVAHGSSAYSPNSNMSSNLPLSNSSTSSISSSPNQTNSGGGVPAYRFKRPEPGIVEAYNADTGELVGRYTLDEAEEMFGDLLKFKKGGRIEKSKNSALNAVARSVGEDTLVAAKAGEAILTKAQSDAIIKLAPIMEQMRSTLTRGRNKITGNSRDISNNLNIGSIVTVNGDVTDNNVDRIATLARREVRTTLGQMEQDLKYDGYR